MDKPAILSLRDYHKHFHINKYVTVKALNGVSFDVMPGEVFSLVGESGSGKSTLARAVMGFYPASKGEIYFKDLLVSTKKAYRKNKRRFQTQLQIVFQDSAASLNPRMKVTDIIAEPMAINKIYRSKAEREEKVSELMAQVGLDPIHAKKTPSEISGGQRQRVAIARAISLEPELIVADEPVASLDVSIQAQIINLFERLREEKNITFLFIAHDLSLVRFISDRVGVLYSGKIVELAPTSELFENPLHPYTKSLLSAAPVPDPVYERTKKLLPFDKSLFNPSGSLEMASEGHYVLSF